jgi:hypothetical protein
VAGGIGSGSVGQQGAGDQGCQGRVQIEELGGFGSTDRRLVSSSEPSGSKIAG